jgi:hypothetical protein
MCIDCESPGLGYLDDATLQISCWGMKNVCTVYSNTPLFEKVSTNFTSRENIGNASGVLPSADNLPRVSISGVGCGRILNLLITHICYTTATDLKTKRILSMRTAHLKNTAVPTVWHVSEYTGLSTDNGLRPTHCLVHLMFVTRYTRQTGRINTVGYATTNECYGEQFLFIKSGCYSVHRCYNESGGILSAEVARACAWRVWPYRFDWSVSHHLCYRWQRSVTSLVQLSAYLYSV